jgi:phosphoribosyl 1,2-cyclic phosphodiesterase
MIEADYDETLLRDYDGYSSDLKDRIISSYGHLSNNQCLEFLKSFGIDRLKTIVIGHLSENTNSPAVLTEHIKEYFPDTIQQTKFHIAPFIDALEL